MKPIVRWTVGPVSDQGIKSLEMSISNWKQIYKDEFDLFVCHNGISLSSLSHLDVEFIDQSTLIDNQLYPPKDTAWKFCPVRLRLESHEIFIDNDLVLYERSEFIDAFLNNQSQFIITSAHKRFYGSYKQFVPEHITINSGLFGFPPLYDFKSDLRMFLLVYPLSGWIDHCDDEGVLACLLSKKDLVVIPMSEIHVCNPDLDFAFYRRGRCGTHFVGVNRGRDIYWNRFLKESM